MYRFQLVRRNLITFSLSLLSALVFLIVIFRDCHESFEIKRNETTIFLDNILDREKFILDYDYKVPIFFVDTTRMKHPEKNHTRKLTIRQSCAIESAANSNKESKIFVILAAPFQLKSVEITDEMEALLKYPNIYFLALDIIEFTIDTPLEDFITGQELFKSIFVKSHTSDALRLLLLWKYGGVYIDTDMIVRLELDQLPNNYICRDYGFLNGAIINLDRKKGREFAEMFMADMVENFNGSSWGYNGPKMLHRVLSKVCGVDDVDLMKICDGFHILPDDFCYPIKGQRWEIAFDEEKGDELMKKVEFSVVVHFWNKLSHNEQLECDSRAVYTQLAHEFCPRTMETCVDYF